MLQEMKPSSTSSLDFFILNIALSTKVVTLKALLKEENLSTSTSGSADITTSALKVALTLLLGAMRLLLAADKQPNVESGHESRNLKATEGHVARKTIVSQIH